MVKTLNRTLFVVVLASSLAVPACRRKAAPGERLYDTPQQAAEALIATVNSGNVNDLIAIFGPEGKELVESNDVADARQNRDVFAAAARERWHLEDGPDGARTLVIGNEDWPFPVPIVHGADGWRFDTAAGKEEVIARRVGRNELEVIQACRTYVAAQHLYAASGHDGQPAGAFAASFKSDPGRQNGLYWPAARHEKRSPLGDLVASAAEEGRSLDTKSAQPAPFHGYYFRILTAQGPAAPGGAKDFMADGRMIGGFALVAWPGAYDSSGVMTFIVGSDGVVREKDLGPGTDAGARSIHVFDPDGSWSVVADGSSH